jgi:hypothetical protein
VPSPSAYISQHFSDQPPPPVRQSTHPLRNVSGIAPAPAHTHDHALHTPAPHLSGSVSHHSSPRVPVISERHLSTNSGLHAPTTQRSATIPIPVHPNPAPPVPYYNSSPPNPNIVYPPSRSGLPGGPQPIAPGRGHRLTLGRPTHGETATPPQVSCKSCGLLKPRHEVEHLGGFCSEMHKWQWSVVITSFQGSTTDYRSDHSTHCTVPWVLK